MGDYEADMVAYCTMPGRGTRLIPEGALQGVQWITTPDYIEVTVQWHSYVDTVDK